MKKLQEVLCEQPLKVFINFEIIRMVQRIIFCFIFASILFSNNFPQLFFPWFSKFLTSVTSLLQNDCIVILKILMFLIVIATFCLLKRIFSS
jgi:hypothetical protein